MYVSRFTGDEDVVLRMPPGRRVSDLKWVSWSCYVLIIYCYPCGVLKTPWSRFRNTLVFLLRWLSVWCREYAVDFGHTGIDAWPMVSDHPTSPVLSPNKLSVHSVDIIGILSARYLFLAPSGALIGQGCRRFLTISYPRWDQPISEKFIKFCLWAADIDA